MTTVIFADKLGDTDDIDYAARRKHADLAQEVRNSI